MFYRGWGRGACMDRQFRQNDSKRRLVSGRDSIESRRPDGRRRPLVRAPLRIAAAPPAAGSIHDRPAGPRDRSGLRRPVYGPYIGRASAARLITLSRMIYFGVGRPRGQRRRR